MVIIINPNDIYSAKVVGHLVLTDFHSEDQSELLHMAHGSTINIILGFIIIIIIIYYLWCKAIYESTVWSSECCRQLICQAANYLFYCPMEGIKPTDFAVYLITGSECPVCHPNVIVGCRGWGR